jgi:hypothetical protein
MSYPNQPNPTPWKPSTALPNPYGEGATSTATYQTSPGYGGPYGPPGTPPGPAKSGSGCLIAGIIGGVITVLGVLCAGCGFSGFFVLDARYQETARKLSVEYHNDPKVKEEVGEVQEITYNWSATIARDDQLDVFDVRGDKGSAQFVVDADEEEIYSVTLQNSRGEWELPSDAPPHSE